MKNELVNSFLEFSAAANLRSTVDIRDGLKPVHRRILYVLNGYSGDKYVGSGKVVGDVLGGYHPHGDTSVYDAAVRLSQDFKTRYPLIDLYGGNGTVADPTNVAAQRYTKMKLTDLGKLALVNINKDTVDMTENYSGDLLEPVNLPGMVPITLLNGTLGIGVGMASSIPPHNLKEVAAAITMKIDNPLATTKDLMRVLKGPDFPTGGTITNQKDLLEAYSTGKGSVKLKTNYSIETIKGQTHIIITEVPFLVDPTKGILAPLREMVQNGYEYIEDYENQTGKGVPFRLDITLTKDAPVFEVVDHLLKETSIQSNFNINLTTHLGNNKFGVLSLPDMIDRYILQATDVLKRSYVFDKNKAEKRLLIVNGLIIASQQIDLVVSIIKNSSDTASAKRTLIKELNLLEVQATSILAMRLSQLTKMDKVKLDNEKTELENKISMLDKLINSKELQLEEVKKFLKDLSSKYGDARRTRINEEQDFSESKNVTVFVTNDGEIFAADDDSLPENNRNTKGKVWEDVISFYETTSDSYVDIITSDGMVNSISVAAIGVNSDRIKNTTENLGIRGKAVQVTLLKKADFLVSVTNQGTLKKSDYSDYNMDRSYKVAKVRDGEEISKVFSVNKGDHFIMILNNNKYVLFSEDEINCTGINTIGTKAGSRDILSIDVADGDILFLDADSNGKVVNIKNLKESGRKTAGLTCNESIFAAGLPNSKVLIWGEDGKMIRIKQPSSTSSPTSKGVILYNGKIGKILTS